MPEVTLTVDEDIATALNALQWTKIDDHALSVLIRADLTEVSEDLSKIAGTADWPSAEEVRHLADQLARCATALEAVAA